MSEPVKNITDNLKPSPTRSFTAKTYVAFPMARAVIALMTLIARRLLHLDEAG